MAAAIFQAAAKMWLAGFWTDTSAETEAFWSSVDNLPLAATLMPLCKTSATFEALQWALTPMPLMVTTYTCDHRDAIQRP